jgi:Cu/Ag efflux protein CusF
MKKGMALVLSFALVFGAAVVWAADNTASGGGKKAAKGVVMTDLVTVTATVQAVDVAKRTITLKGPEGNVRTLKVGKRVKNLARLKPGDQVEFDYLESVALYVTPPGGNPDAVAGRLVEVSAPGKKPGAVMANTVEVKAKVEAVDAAKRTVTLKGPDGNVTTFKVWEKVNLDKIKAGDNVVARYTEAVTVSVRTPAKGKDAASK